MIFEIASAAAIILIATSFLTSSSLSMPGNVVSVLLVLLFLAFLSFAALIWKENSSDEREAFHTLTAGRISFLAGVGVLVVGTIAQTAMHNIDPWLIIALCTMVIVKIILLIYTSRKM